MQAVKRVLGFPLVCLAVFAIYFYKFVISPFLPKVCRFYPTCSSYALSAVKSFGFFRGAIIAGKRLLRCSGKNKGGCDYIPDNIKGEFRWLV